MASKFLLSFAAIGLLGFVVYVFLWKGISLDRRKTKVSQVRNKPLDARLYNDVKTFLLFIGYNRSRHTLLASLLDAHPNVIIANDFNILGQWIQNPLLSQRKKEFIYELLFAKSRYDAMFGVRARKLVDGQPTSYHYNVKDQWQGRYDRYLQVIGDKKAARASRILQEKEGMDSLKKLQDKLGVQLKFIHVIRNPFDNIATMSLRRAQEKKQGQENLKVNHSAILDESITSYFELANGSAQVKKTFPGRVHDIASIDLMYDTRGSLEKMCAFLEVTCSEQYLQDCASIVNPVPSKTRFNVEWTKGQLDRVRSLIKDFPFLHRYSFES